MPITGGNPNPSTSKILEWIDRALDLIGENVKIVLYWKMERELGLRREDIPAKPGLFAKSLEAMFGTGAVIMERVLIKQIRIESGIVNLPEQDLAKVIDEVQRRRDW